MKTQYLCAFGWDATGEGSTNCLGAMDADSPDQARDIFLRKTFYADLVEWAGEDEGRNATLREQIKHFAPSVGLWTKDDLTNVDTLAAVRRKLEAHLSPIAAQSVLDAFTHGGALHEFTFHLYTNYS